MKATLTELVLGYCDGDIAKAKLVGDVLEKIAVDFLSLRDYSLIPPDVHEYGFEIETPTQFQERLRISTSHFARRLASPDCPPFWKDTGNTGRIKRLRSNPQLDKHMQPVQKRDRSL